MQITKEQWGKIISAVLVFILALLSAFGYDVLVDKPREQAAIQQAEAQAQLETGIVSRAVGYNTACYMEQGGQQLTCDSPGTIQMNTGSTLDMNAGTLQFEGATANAYETVLGVVDPTADRTATLPNASGYVMLGGGAGKYVFGSNTITGTLTVSHGLTTPEDAFCTLLADPVANAAHCSATISGSNVVVKTWKSDGVTAGSVGALVAWVVTGQP